jgi:hypothetical protein
MESCRIWLVAWAKVVAASDEQFPAFHQLGLIASLAAQEYQAVDLTWLRLNRCYAGRVTAHASADNRYTLGADLSQVMNRRQHIEVKRRIQRLGLAGAARLAVTTEVDGQDTESGFHQGLRLFFPTLLVKAAPVSQHDPSVAFAVQVGVD